MQRFILWHISLCAFLASGSLAFGQVRPGTTPAAKPAATPAAKPATTSAAAATPEPPKEIGGKKLKEWIKDFDDKDPSVRQLAVRVVMFFGPGARDALPFFRYKDEDVGIRCDIADNMAGIGRMILEKPMDAKAKQDFARVMATLAYMGSKDNATSVRLRVAHALGQCVGQYMEMIAKIKDAKPDLGPQHREAINAMIRAVQDKQSFEVRKAAAFALGYLGRNPGNSPDEDSFTALYNAACTDPCREVRVQAVMALSAIGKPSTGRMDWEKKMLVVRYQQDPDRTIQIWSLRLLMYLDENYLKEVYVKRLAGYLSDKDPNVRIHAIKALGTLGRYAKPHIQQMINCLDSKDIELKLVTIIALGVIEDVASPAVQKLRDLQKSDNPAVKQAATNAIEKITNPASREKKKTVGK